jgi:uncharacterized protein (TIGR02246 family)
MRNLLSIIAVTVLAVMSPAVFAESIDELRERVRDTEVAFAKTMADRDHDAFASFLADEAIFLSGRTVLRGRDAVAQAWKPYFEAPDAPFSWAPETVEVLDSGTLAISTGPVFAPDGSRVGTFNSTWRQQKDGSWRIVFDNGCPPCRCGSE